MAAVAALLAASVLLSRVLGYVREVVLANQLGTTPGADAYRAAFQIPDLLNQLLAAGAFSIAFLPLYTRARAERGDAAADELLGVVLGTLTGVAALLTLILWIFAESLVAIQFPRFDPYQQVLVARLTRIVLPAQVCFVAGGLLRAALMARDRFATQALAPLLYNAGIIAGGLLGAGGGPEGFAWGALAGAALGQLVLAVADVRAARLRLRWRFAPLDPRFRAYLLTAAPLMLGMSLLTVDEWYERWFGALLGSGSVAQLAYARQLMLLPVAVVGQALATAALPTLARLASEGRDAELGSVLEATLRAALGLAILAAAGLALLAGPLVAVIFEHGRFTAQDSAAVAGILRVLALAVPAWVVQQIAVRAFFARGDTWRPMLLGTALALTALPLYLALGPRLGVQGLAAAGAIGISVNALATLLLARRLHGAPRLLPLAASALRSALATALGVGAALAAERVAVPGGALGELARGAVALGLAGGAALLLLGDAPTRRALARVGARLRRPRR